MFNFSGALIFEDVHSGESEKTEEEELLVSVEIHESQNYDEIPEENSDHQEVDFQDEDPSCSVSSILPSHLDEECQINEAEDSNQGLRFWKISLKY